ncbi:MAG: orotidine-5'-phosphate decarboxylase, partial [Planctomycetaceae bacterium]|nr:orotidine-5'-phosphate decarboxylase [Planctomycetaceae bacterium]
MSNSPNHFADRLTEAIATKETPLMVGIDPRLGNLPAALREGIADGDYSRTATAFESFGKEVIDVVAPMVAAIKPQSAFFEQLGPAGTVALANVVDHAVERGLLVIMDGKRNDIGSTAMAYAKAYLGKKPDSAWG